MVGCAGGEPGGGFTSLTFGPTDTTPQTDTGEATEDTGMSTAEPDTGVMTSNVSEDTGPDPDTGPSPDTGSESDTGPDPDAGCVVETEVCNGADEDCDLQIDNGNPGGGQPCNTGMSGVCAEGVTNCENGAIACTPTVVAMAETCNGADDDCNGEPDDGNPGGGGGCNTGMPGICGPGTNQCSGGALVCQQNQGAQGETCNGIDDDCNGQVDNGNPGGGGGCNTGQQGICGPGTFVCSGGGLVCQQNQGPVGEVCGNGADDDCNGQVDNGCGGGPCPFDLCTSPGLPQVNGCDPCVTQVCAADPFCCNNQWDGICVNEVETVCGLATCISPSCAHPVCVAGGALANGCHPCVTQICGVDAFCCNTSWDGLCVGEVGSVCGLTC